MKALGTFGAVLLGLLVVAALAVGGWKLGWWMQEESTNRRTSIANDSLARQQALVDEVTDKAADLRRIDVQVTTATPEQAAALNAQRAAIVDQFCSAYGGLTNRITVSASVAALASQECS